MRSLLINPEFGRYGHKEPKLEPCVVWKGDPSANPLLRLPTEVILLVLEQLGRQELREFSLVDRQCCQAARSFLYSNLRFDEEKLYSATCSSFYNYDNKTWDKDTVSPFIRRIERVTPDYQLNIDFDLAELLALDITKIVPLAIGLGSHLESNAIFTYGLRHRLPRAGRVDWDADIRPQSPLLYSFLPFVTRALLRLNVKPGDVKAFREGHERNRKLFPEKWRLQQLSLFIWIESPKSPEDLVDFDGQDSAFTLIQWILSSCQDTLISLDITVGNLEDAPLGSFDKDVAQWKFFLPNLRSMKLQSNVPLALQLAVASAERLHSLELWRMDEQASRICIPSLQCLSIVQGFPTLDVGHLAKFLRINSHIRHLSISTDLLDTPSLRQLGRIRNGSGRESSLRNIESLTLRHFFYIKHTSQNLDVPLISFESLQFLESFQSLRYLSLSATALMTDGASKMIFPHYSFRKLIRHLKQLENLGFVDDTSLEDYESRYKRVSLAEGEVDVLDYRLASGWFLNERGGRSIPSDDLVEYRCPNDDRISLNFSLAKRRIQDLDRGIEWQDKTFAGRRDEYTSQNETPPEDTESQGPRLDHRFSNRKIRLMFASTQLKDSFKDLQRRPMFWLAFFEFQTWLEVELYAMLFPRLRSVFIGDMHWKISRRAESTSVATKASDYILNYIEDWVLERWGMRMAHDRYLLGTNSKFTWVFGNYSDGFRLDM